MRSPRCVKMGTEFINDSVSPHTKENCRTFRTAVLDKRRFLKRQILSSSLKDCDAPHDILDAISSVDTNKASLLILNHRRRHTRVDGIGKS